jgi:2,4-dienoyl-CoA reductase-like NADH-dependent reductase (Old Yellow Enzyme family)
MKTYTHVGPEETPVPKLLDPLSIGDLSLKNRIVMPPMANDLATTKGEERKP